MHQGTFLAGHSDHLLELARSETNPELTLERAMQSLKERNRLLPGDQVVVVSDVQAGGERIEAVQVRTFE